VTTSHTRTYGVADRVIATVDGVWDALLGEGRDRWVFNNGDSHVVDKSNKAATGKAVGLAHYVFWPGQYAQICTGVGDLTDEGIVNGMRSGNSSSSTAISSMVSNPRLRRAHTRRPSAGRWRRPPARI